MLLLLIMCHVRHAYLGLLLGVSPKGRTTCIWSLICGFACANTMGCGGLELSFSIIIVL